MITILTEMTRFSTVKTFTFTWALFIIFFLNIFLFSIKIIRFDKIIFVFFIFFMAIFFVTFVMFFPFLLGGGNRGQTILFTKITAIKNIKNTKIILSNLMIFMLKRKMFQKNMINKAQVKVNVLIVENLVISVRIVIRNLVS